MKKVNLIRVILIILLVLTFIKIFDFSSQNSEKSSNLSRTITEKVTSKIKFIQNLDTDKKEKVLHRAEIVVRKLAHFSEYTLVGILLMALMSTYEIKNKLRVLVSFIIGVVYASSDEIHQSFIPGRTASIIDVGIDTSGVLLGIILVLIIISVYKALTEKKVTDI